MKTKNTSQNGYSPLVTNLPDSSYIFEIVQSLESSNLICGNDFLNTACMWAQHKICKHISRQTRLVMSGCEDKGDNVWLHENVAKPSKKQLRSKPMQTSFCLQGDHFNWTSLDCSTMVKVGSRRLLSWTSTIQPATQFSESVKRWSRRKRDHPLFCPVNLLDTVMVSINWHCWLFQQRVARQPGLVHHYLHIPAPKPIDSCNG